MNDTYTRNVKIIEFISARRNVTTEEIAKEFFLSESSVRRILETLERQGAIRRVHGGASVSEKNAESALHVRSLVNLNAKRKLAEFAKGHIPFFTSAFIDNSSTILELAKILDLKGKTIATNGLSIALELSQSDCKELILLGGVVRKSSTGIYGSRACEALNGFNFDLLLYSCAAIDEKGAYESTDDVASFKYASRPFGKHAILLVDSSKFQKIAPCRSAYLRDFDLIITDAKKEEIKPLIDAGFNVITSSSI